MKRSGNVLVHLRFN